MSWIQTTGRLFYDFALGDVDDFILLSPTGASIAKITNGFNLIQPNASDARIYLPHSPTINAGTVSLDVTVPTSGSTIGICFRTTSLSAVANTYGLYFGITQTGWAFSRASDSTYSSETVTNSGTGSYVGRHTIKIVFNGSTLTCYIDGVQVLTTTLTYYTSGYGFIMPRVYQGNATGIFHSMEILSSVIKDTSLRNINRFVKVVFDREIHFPYSSLKSHANAFTGTFPWRKYQQDPLGTKTISAIDAQYAVKADGSLDKTTLIVKFDWVDNFESCLGDLTLHYDSSKCTLYGQYTKDVLSSFTMIFTPVNLDGKKSPSSLDIISINLNIGMTISAKPIHYISYTKASLNTIAASITSGMTITPTLTGSIHP